MANFARQRRFAPVGIVLGLAAAIMRLGASVLVQTPASAPRLTVAAIQDLTSGKTGDLAPTKGIDRAQMTREAVRRGAQLVVWSEETPGGKFATEDPKDETRTLARQLKTPLVVGYSDDTRLTALQLRRLHRGQWGCSCAASP